MMVLFNTYWTMPIFFTHSFTFLFIRLSFLLIRLLFYSFAYPFYSFVYFFIHSPILFTHSFTFLFIRLSFLLIRLLFYSTSIQFIFIVCCDRATLQLIFSCFSFERFKIKRKLGSLCPVWWWWWWWWRW